MANPLPSNISDWLKSQGTHAQTLAAKKVQRWLSSVKRHVVGGTSIGKSPQTLILDMTRQGSQFYINPLGRITFIGTIVETKQDFLKVYNSIEP